jgi:hypothetical protein
VSRGGPWLEKGLHDPDELVAAARREYNREYTTNMAEPYEESPPERDRAAEDVWGRTISQIPTTFGRIAYLASLRNENSGSYQHFGLARIYSDDEADRVLRLCHREVFSEWLNFSLPDQRRDLEAYLNSIEDDRKTVLATWLDLSPYRHMIPADATAAERRLYLSDLELILDLLRNELSLSS